MLRLAVLTPGLNPNEPLEFSALTYTVVSLSAIIRAALLSVDLK